MLLSLKHRGDKTKRNDVSLFLSAGLTVVCSLEAPAVGVMNRLPKSHDFIYHSSLSADPDRLCFVVRNNSSEVYDRSHSS